MPAALLATPLGRRLLAAVTLAVAALLIAGLFAMLTVSSLLAGSTNAAAGTGANCPPHASRGGDTATHLTTAQARNARTVLRVGTSLHMPGRGLVVAIATALQESDLRNLNGGDRDSLGLFQQRSSMGWGTADQITNPTYASRQFYRHLQHVHGWQQMTIADAAQAVQKSAFPGAYAQHASRATAIATKLGHGLDTSGCTAPTPAPNATTAHMLHIALAQKGDPYVWGATGPDAFDCSGLVVYAWKRAGYRLTARTSQEMYRLASPVKSGHERPGDLLFSQFGEGGPGPGHVLIVAKRGTAIEAPRTGVPVRTRHYHPRAEHMRIGRLPKSALHSGS